MSNYPSLFLNRREERRLLAGHLWVYSNEVDNKKSPLKQFQAGELVEIRQDNGKSLGIGYVNPNSLICARLLAYGKEFESVEALVYERLKTALTLRDAVYPKPFYRLCFSEGDFLPGLIVDRYGDHLVVQLNTAGMDKHKQDVLQALQKLLNPKSITLRNDASSRQQEGLPEEVEVVVGELPDNISIEENNTQFVISATKGQKTGWFYDHRHNRNRMQSYVAGKKVLDVFSYWGGWAIEALTANAQYVTAIDVSEAATQACVSNAELNQKGDRLRVITADAFDALKMLKTENQQFDVVVVDPPAFIKRKKDYDKGKEAYVRVNKQAMELVAPGGILVSASCSFHMSVDDLRTAVLKASRQAHRSLQILEQGGQGPDHPVHPAIPETAYLKAIFCRVL